MTSYAHYQLPCANCGHTVACSVLKSTNSSGPPDLDTRDNGDARNAMLRAIQQCPACKYCAVEIDELIDRAAETIKDPAYLSFGKDKTIPDDGRKWACYGLLLERAGKLSDAGWAYLYTAWACDDRQLNRNKAAIELRLKAIRMFELAQQHGESFGEDVASESALLVELNRRAERFQEAQGALETLATLMSTVVDPENKDLFASIASFQQHTISIADAHAYDIAEALRFVRDPDKWHPPKWWEIWRY
jgi:hypothetical protein